MRCLLARGTGTRAGDLGHQWLRPTQRWGGRGELVRPFPSRRAGDLIASAPWERLSGAFLVVSAFCFSFPVVFFPLGNAALCRLRGEPGERLAGCEGGCRTGAVLSILHGQGVRGALGARGLILQKRGPRHCRGAPSAAVCQPGLLTAWAWQRLCFPAPHRPQWPWVCGLAFGARSHCCPPGTPGGCARCAPWGQIQPAAVLGCTGLVCHPCHGDVPVLALSLCRGRSRGASGASRPLSGRALAALSHLPGVRDSRQ